jgi:DNA-binding IclR family transcriptional regulator
VSAPIVLTDREVAIAHLVAELVLDALAPDQPRTPGALVDAETVAAALGLTRATVYRRARELGGQKLPGRRGRWRFDLDVARAALGDHAAPECPPVPRRRRGAGAQTDLLPIGRERAA